MTEIDKFLGIGAPGSTPDKIANRALLQSQLEVYGIDPDEARGISVHVRQK
jgi:hypothetical protein